MEFCTHFYRDSLWSLLAVASNTWTNDHTQNTCIFFFLEAFTQNRILPCSVRDGRYSSVRLSLSFEGSIIHSRRTYLTFSVSVSVQHPSKQFMRNPHKAIRFQELLLISSMVCNVAFFFPSYCVDLLSQHHYCLCNSLIPFSRSETVVFFLNPLFQRGAGADHLFYFVKNVVSLQT